MIEVRSPRPEELDEMLSVMCDAFNLPFAPARDIFYRDPYFDVRHKRILVANGRIESCLTIVDAPIVIGSAVVRVAGVAGVATRPEARRQGYATRMIQEVLPLLAEDGFGLAALFAAEPSFYLRLNWQPAQAQIQASVPITALVASRYGRYVRPALPSDLAEMMRLYEDWSRERSGCRVRDEKRWRYLFEHVKYRVVYRRKHLHGYALYDVRQIEAGRPTLRLLELVAETETAQTGLLTHLGLRSDCESLEYSAGWRELGESGLVEAAGTAAPASLSVTAGPLVKMVDFERCMCDLSPNWSGFEGCVTLMQKDRPGDRHPSASVTVEGGGGRCAVRKGIEGENPRAFVEGDASTWALLAFGKMNLLEAASLGKLRASTEAVAMRAAPLFPRRDFSIPAADHF
jgi:GNAT superfamily N-acetyltransferase